MSEDLYRLLQTEAASRFSESHIQNLVSNNPSLKQALYLNPFIKIAALDQSIYFEINKKIEMFLSLEQILFILSGESAGCVFKEMVECNSGKEQKVQILVDYEPFKQWMDE